MIDILTLKNRLITKLTNDTDVTIRPIAPCDEQTKYLDGVRGTLLEKALLA